MVLEGDLSLQDLSQKSRHQKSNVKRGRSRDGSDSEEYHTADEGDCMTAAEDGMLRALG